ncbi:hypothetical protein L211DRAFT_849215 [Terfezia boudieri ATCC MYA-4762]|uniref:Uncharacterized protein n=1 Tax=Terfezia boudieri ATCC MYA-4762 TaxID=1051890 RepID=A0A3N4LMA7_9PEZI|nr:hypothetical protein L211DRAFT_849215 [Terfezia boudieri ATCC MYA-4762]
MVCGGPGVSAHGGEYIVHMNLHGVWFLIVKRAVPFVVLAKMPYSSPRPPSVQWQPQTRRRSAPHSPTLRPRTTPPESVEDLSFPETGSLSLAPAAAPPTPGSFPTIVTALPAFKPLPQPTTQRPHSHKLPVSNASATKARNTKDRVTTSSSRPSSEPEAREPQSTSVLVTSEAPVRKHKPRDPNRLTNGVEKLAFNRVEKAETNKVEKPMVNGIDKPLVNGHQEASPAPQSWPPSGSEIPVLQPQPVEPQPTQPPQASRKSDDQGRSIPEDPEKAVTVTSDTPRTYLCQ